LEARRDAECHRGKLPSMMMHTICWIVNETASSSIFCCQPCRIPERLFQEDWFNLVQIALLHRQSSRLLLQIEVAIVARVLPTTGSTRASYIHAHSIDGLQRISVNLGGTLGNRSACHQPCLDERWYAPIGQLCKV
jgi:hypothetical protein